MEFLFKNHIKIDPLQDAEYERRIREQQHEEMLKKYAQQQQAKNKIDPLDMDIRIEDKKQNTFFDPDHMTFDI